MNNLMGFLLDKIDRFLPANIRDQVSLITFYRMRVVQAITIACVFVTTFFLFISKSILGLPEFIIWMIILSLSFFCFTIFYVKNLKVNIEKRVNLIALLQVIFITGTIYLSSVSEKGMGAFGLAWYFPVIIMLAFFVDRGKNIFVFLIFMLFNIISVVINFKSGLVPISKAPNFYIVYLAFLFLTLTLSYVIAIIFERLNQDLNLEVEKHRELLIASAKFNSLGQMASTLAHDINNPLLTIQGKIHQMRNLLSRNELDLNRCDEIIESTEKTILKLSDITKAISNYAREGRVEDFALEDASTLVDNILNLCRDRIYNNGITLKVEFESDAYIFCHPSFFSQIFLNLINNAIDALEGVEHKLIEIKVINLRQKIRIEVIDSGLGVQTGDEEKIFKAFYTTKKLNKGTGLGLSISLGLVELHHGELKYERKNNRSYFIVTLPHADTQMSDE